MLDDVFIHVASNDSMRRHALRRDVEGSFGAHIAVVAASIGATLRAMLPLSQLACLSLEEKRPSEPLQGPLVEDLTQWVVALRVESLLCHALLRLPRIFGHREALLVEVGLEPLLPQQHAMRPALQLRAVVELARVALLENARWVELRPRSCVSWH